jgi:hypothetical protein
VTGSSLSQDLNLSGIARTAAGGWLSSIMDGILCGMDFAKDRTRIYIPLSICRVCLRRDVFLLPATQNHRMYPGLGSQIML